MAGFLSRTIDRIRMFADEPSTNAKYSDTQLIDLIESAWTDLLHELSLNSQAPIIVRHDITFSSSSQSYVLPPTVGSIIRLAKINSTTDAVEWDVYPRSRYNPSGPGVTFEGNIIRLGSVWSGDSDTLRLEYIPTGSVRLHDGTAGTITNDATNDQCTVVLASTPTNGSLDVRPNAYAGQVFRVLTATTNNYIQERIIKSYDVTTATITLQPAFDASLVPGGATVTYEIAPMLYQADDIAVALLVASQIVAIDGDTSRARRLERETSKKMRQLRLRVANVEAIIGSRFVSDTAHNVRYVAW